MQNPEQGRQLEAENAFVYFLILIVKLNLADDNTVQWLDSYMIGLDEFFMRTIYKKPKGVLVL